LVALVLAGVGCVAVAIALDRVQASSLSQCRAFGTGQGVLGLAAAGLGFLAARSGVQLPKLGAVGIILMLAGVAIIVYSAWKFFGCGLLEAPIPL
jgi:hypothetical protein